MTPALPIVLALGLAASGCSILITPTAIAESEEVPPDTARRLNRRWYEAVSLANGYLASPFRRSLPYGRLDLDGDLGMRFVVGEDAWPVQVACSIGGWFAVLFGGRAQERDGGFVVGPAPPDENGLIDNSMFKKPDGLEYSEAALADLILHQTAHIVYDEGTIGVWGAITYYTELIFTWRTTNHSAKRLPNAVSAEFRLWWRSYVARMNGDYDPLPFLDELEQRLAEEPGGESHGAPE